MAGRKAGRTGGERERELDRGSFEVRQTGNYGEVAGWVFVFGSADQERWAWRPGKLIEPGRDGSPNLFLFHRISDTVAPEIKTADMAGFAKCVGATYGVDGPLEVAFHQVTRGSFSPPWV